MSGNTPKILIVVAVVIAVLFVAGTGIGLSGGLPGISLEGVLNTFGGLLPSPGVTVAELSTSPEACLNRQLQRIVVPALGQCQIVVGPSQARIRVLTLTSQSALRVRAALTPVEDRTLTVTARLPGDEEPANQLTIDIFGEGASLIIDQCAPVSGDACIVDL